MSVSDSLDSQYFDRFIPRTMPTYQMSRHHILLANILQQWYEGSITRLMVFAPPRHGKTEQVSRRLPAFLLGNCPDDEVIACSYADALASRNNRDVQRIMDGAAYRELYPNVRLSDGKRGGASRTENLFEITGRRGSYRSAGVGGAITGMGFRWGIIDDPYKNAEDSHSPTMREKILEWYHSTFWTRQAPGARILLTMTRWHHDDLAGRLLQAAAADPTADQWHVVRLPAIADRDLHAMDTRQAGEALWPERYPVEFMQAARAGMGSYFFTGMYQQTPVVDGGNLFKASWFRTFADMDSHWLVNGDLFHKSDCPVFCCMDPAISKKQTADCACIGTFAMTPKNDLLILDMVNERLGIENLIPRLLEVATIWKPSWVACEADGFQISIVREARRTQGMPPVRELSHEGKGKIVRAQPAMIRAEGGQIYLHAGKPWVKPFVDELIRFDGLDGGQDGQVDVLAYAVWQMPRMYQDRTLDRDLEHEHSSLKPEHESMADKLGLWGRGR